MSVCVCLYVGASMSVAVWMNLCGDVSLYGLCVCAVCMSMSVRV